MITRDVPYVVTSVVVPVISAIFLGGCGGKTAKIERATPTPDAAPIGRHAHAHTNRLAGQMSPYLLQHAHNPVDWYPWGEEAFAKARRENKPIFLSVGYSTCHWCHVMERESFENEEIAALLNRSYVAVKVDREERPDVDKVYMTYVQATTGGGGWPMSVWLTPDLKPFLGGTYFPPEDRWGRPGFKSVLTRIAEAWEQDRNAVVATADNAARQLIQFTIAPAADAAMALEQSLLDAGYARFQALYDPRQGGFSGAPKFPRPVALNFLLRYHARTGAQEARDMALFTLRKMAGGGMRDHLGGGFHRYSVDDEWHVPHFEKMLYDQAQLACAYLDAHQITRDPFFAGVARDILDYVRRDLTGPEGGFYSAEDADSPRPGRPEEHAEGAFYVWEHREIGELLGEERAKLFSLVYDVQPHGNVRNDPHGEFTGRNVLMMRTSGEAAAAAIGRDPAAVERDLADSRKRLFDSRAQRPRPHLDDKIITAWNGLMLSSFARAYQILEDPAYLRAAERAAAFIRARLFEPESGDLMRRYRDGEAAIDGFVDDYAYLIQGLLDLYEASFDVRHLEWALALQEKQNALFWDGRNGGYFNTIGGDASVLLRMKEDYDGAEPSPNSVAILNLLRLHQMTDRAAHRDMAEQALRAFGTQLRQAPTALPQMLVAVDFHLDKPRQIILAGDPEAADTRAMLREIHARFLPNKILMLADGGAGQAALAQQLEFVEQLARLDGNATAYVCENFVCALPTNDREILRRLLTQTPPDGHDASR